MKFTLQNSAYPVLGVLVVALSCAAPYIVPGGTSDSVTGSYAGVLNPGCIHCSFEGENGQLTQVKCREREAYLASHPHSTDQSNCPEKQAPGNDQDCAANSLGVFSVSVPSTGIGSGDFVMFAQGRVFTGTIRAVADPTSSKLNATLDATFNFTVHGRDILGMTTDIDVTASATGNMNATIQNQFSFTGSTISDKRLKGAADLSISHGEVQSDLTPRVSCQIPLRVIGFRQSTDAGATSGG